MKNIVLILTFALLVLLGPLVIYAQDPATGTVLSLDTSKYLSANNEADKELEFRLFVQPGLEDPKRDINLRLLQNKIRNEHKRRNR